MTQRHAQQCTLSMLRSSADLNGRSPRILVRSSVFTTCTALQLDSKGAHGSVMPCSCYHASPASNALWGSA